jgi:hypothetical protein
MARHRSKQNETQVKTRALKESPRGVLGRTLSASLLRTITGGGGREANLEIPPPPPDTRG